MNLVHSTKLSFSILVQSLAIIFLITAEISAESNTPKKPAPTQPNPKNSVVTPTKNRPPISEGSKPSNPIPAKDKPNNPPVSIPEVVKPKPMPLPKKPNNPPVSIPEVVKPKPMPIPTKPANPPVAIPEVVKPTPVPLPKKPANPPVSIPEVVKLTPVPFPLRKALVSDRKPLPPTGVTKAPIQEAQRYTTYSDRNNQRNALNNQNYYHQQTVRDFYEHTRKYPQPISRNQGYTNNFNTYSWVNNNRYFYGYNYRNYNYITCYDRFNNRFSIITIPNDNQNYPVVIQPYPPVIIQPYPIGYYQTFDTTGFLSPILMLLRIAQGNYIW